MAIVFPSALRLSDENKNKIYEEYEKMMVEYAKVSPLRDRDRIELSELMELKEVKDNCSSGYVLIDHTDKVPKYTAYITCGSYTTSTPTPQP